MKENGGQYQRHPAAHFSSRPLGKVTLARQLDEGLRLYRVTCPIGVIAMIFEARPDAMIQISSLAVKSGNCAILKGGKRRKKRTAFFFPPP